MSDLTKHILLNGYVVFSKTILIAYLQELLDHILYCGHSVQITCDREVAYIFTFLFCYPHQQRAIWIPSNKITTNLESFVSVNCFRSRQYGKCRTSSPQQVYAEKLEEAGKS